MTRIGGTLLDGPRAYRLLAVGVIVTFILLAGRLWYLQVLRGDHYYRKTEGNFIKEIDLPASRGQVFDRKGRLLIDNRPSYSIYATPRFVSEESFARLARYLHLDADRAAQLKARIAAKAGRDRFRQLLLVDDVSRNDMATVESHKGELPGISVDAQPHRYYPEGKLGAHVLGYMNEVSAEELVKLREQGYRIGDYIGRSGVERQWESFLRGHSGFERIFVDAKGLKKSELEAAEILESFAGNSFGGGPRRREPEPGCNLHLALDIDVQRYVEKALSHHRSAAAAVIEVKTGRVIALASYPTFDPNVLTGKLTHEEDERLHSDPFRPLIDKAVRENYYPGSTFKIVPALAGLEDKQVTPGETMTCRGEYELPGHTFRCMRWHGLMTLHSAMVESCNVFFYHLAERVGMDRMARLAAELGFGAPTGVGLSGEVAGFIPTQEYYRQNGGFRIGYTLNTAIGQGSTTVTVLQLALAYAAIANGGRLFVPALVDRLQTPAGEVVQAFPPRVRNTLTVSPENLQRVRDSLCGVVNEEKGTVYEFRDPEPAVTVCGKSGTAQVRKVKRGQTPGWDIGNDHAWFASYAPAEDPEIAVVVLVEHGGLGGHIAAPTAFQIYRDYFGPAENPGRPRHRPTAAQRTATRVARNTVRRR